MELQKYQAALDAVPVIRSFLGELQMAAMAELSRGEEGGFYLQKFSELAQCINTMPTTGRTDGQGDSAIAQLHYFLGGSDWYITEKDIDGGVMQAFGLAILNGDAECAEYGYISITELVQHGAELDLHFQPKPMHEVKAIHGIKLLPSSEWVVVRNPGQDDQAEIAEADSQAEALTIAKREGGDVMRRLPDGVLTTEF